MVLYLFHSSLVEDVMALTPTPVADHLPHGKKKDAWRLRKQVANEEPLPTAVPWGTIVEQVSRYGYCLVHRTHNGEFGPSLQEHR